ncbi:MAG: matrixin family metalloprotease [Pseudomonadota bacterium]
MKKSLIGAAAALALLPSLTIAANAHDRPETGRQLDIITDPLRVVEIRGEMMAESEVVGIFWDERCASVEYTFNSNQPANPGTPNEISPEVLAATIQTGLDRWNDNPSAYIEMNVTNITDLGNRPRAPFDFINEATFITPVGFTAIASSPSFSLAADTTFVTGDDLDADGDSDVYDPDAEGLNICTDIDGDGDIEFPAGDYLAGTILDNDVQFSSTLPWALEPTDSPEIDVDAISTHEFGHSHGISHTLVNQISASDGDGSTMFPFVDTTDADAEADFRSLASDDIAASAFIYPEGQGTEPITQVSGDDVAFDDVYDIISGSVEFDPVFSGTGQSENTIGASISMRNADGIFSQAYSGKATVYNGTSIFFPESYVSGDFNVPVLKGGVYRAEMEAPDGDPAAGANISTTAIIAQILGTLAIPEEGWTRRDGAFELTAGNASPIPSFRDGIDLTVNNEGRLFNHDDELNFVGTGAISAAAGADTVIYAEQFDGETVLAIIEAGDVPVAGTFRTGTLDSSRVPFFIEARLSLGTVDENGVVTITRTLRRDRGFVGQDGDSTRFNFGGPRGLARQLQRQLTRNPDLDVFLVLEGNDLLTATGPSGFPPAFLGLDSSTDGTSYRSINGAPLALVGGTTQIVDLIFSLQSLR